MFKYRNPGEAYEAAERKIASVSSRQTRLDLSIFGLRRLPADIGKLVQLRELDLSVNTLRSLPPEIWQLTRLQKLNLEDNMLSELPPEIGWLSELQSLNLRKNRLRSLPPQISGLSALRELNLLENKNINLRNGEIESATSLAGSDLSILGGASQELAHALVQHLNRNDRGLVIELRSNSNSITEAIINHGISQSRMVIISGGDAARAGEIQRAYPQATIVNSSPFEFPKVERIVSKREVAAIIWGVPEGLIPDRQALRIGFLINRILRLGGAYIRTVEWPSYFPNPALFGLELEIEERFGRRLIWFKERLWVYRLVKKDQASNYVDENNIKDIESTDEVRQGGSFVDKQSNDADEIVGLPTEPPQFWQPRSPGRPKAGEGSGKLLKFILDVYGPYLPKYRSKLRQYIWRNDRALYKAIDNFEQNGGVLPQELAMPSERDISDERIERVRRGELDQLPSPERNLAKRRAWRRERQLKR